MQSEALILTFELSGQKSAFIAAQIVQLLRIVALSPVQNGPKCLEGFVNMHGDIIPVLDIREGLGLKPKRIENTDVLVILWIESSKIAVRVDRVHALLNVEVQQAGIANILPKYGNFSVGAVKLDDGLIFIYDLKAFLDKIDQNSLFFSLQKASTP